MSKHKRKEQSEKKCVVCGVTYIPISNRQLTCSQVCRTTRNNRVNSEWHRKHRDGVPYTPTDNNKPYVLKDREPPSMTLEFRHLRPGDPDFEEIAKRVTPLERIKDRAIPGKLIQMDGKFIPYY